MTHIKIHSRKDYKCELCGKTFGDGGKLRKYILNIHEGHKNYKCELCEELFSTSSNLKLHINSVHDGRRDHSCIICSKTFSRKGNLATNFKNSWAAAILENLRMSNSLKYIILYQ